MGEQNGDGMKLLILYASEHGSGLDVARIIYRRARCRGVPCHGMSIADYDIADLMNQKLILFIVSTVGLGQEPTPMRNFWKLLMRKSLPKHIFSHLNTAVIGLGDSSYAKFNVVAKKLHRRLLALGANMMIDFTMGDDAHDLGLWAGIDSWLPGFWTKLTEFFPNMIGEEDIDEELLPPPTFSILSSPPPDSNGNLSDTTTAIDGSKSGSQKLDSKFRCDESHPYASEVVFSKRVTPDDHFQDVRFVELRIDADNDPQLKYDSGDVVMILPKNFPEETDEFITLMNLDPDQKIYLKRENCDFNDIGIYDNLPRPCTVKTLVSDYMDIHSRPKRSFFDLLWRFSNDEMEKSKLKEFASTAGQFELYNYCQQPKRTIIEVLRDFHDTAGRVPLKYILDLVPPIRSRAFSIASCLQSHPDRVQILVAVVEYQTRLRKPRQGLASNYIKNLNPGDIVRIWYQKGEFVVPLDKPLVMIGPGTGVTPFRAMIEDRVNRGISDNTLYFGCRLSTADFFFQDEWSKYQSSKMLRLVTAFSRDNPDQKVYVQHKMWEDRDILSKRLLYDDAVFLIAGSSNQMPEDVMECIKKILMCDEQFSKGTDNEINMFIHKLEQTKRIQFECWS
ncbi:NADPH-dependent diflavin oxidoreductase 1 [Brevipalpus obovatus]|uniref:NADPH-dependent diflavin oxidoreductase 1 n=1 Tax=Brevipalpus obovatus TaxID=246614 RepID=UPI003D9EB493